MSENQLYNQQFYANQSRESFESAKLVLDILKTTLLVEILSVVDFGCGVGSWLAAASELGVKTIVGTDGDYVPKGSILIPEASFFSNDLSKPSSIVLPQKRFDLVISLEVAEHLSSSVACSFVRTLCNSADVVLFSAAIPYQGGHGHINENWPEYWATIFAGFGFFPFDIIRPAIWRNDKICWWYRQNILLFIKKDKATTILPNYLPTPIEHLSIVHPEQYLVSVQRNNKDIKRSNGKDVSYWRSLTKVEGLPNPNYGTEFSYTEEEINEITSIDELYRAESYKKNPVIKDALSGVVKIVSNSLISVKPETIEGRSPDFLCIGVQKSATTWLYQVFKNQSDIWVAPIKELNFFNSLCFAKTSAYSGVWRRETALNRLNYALTNNKNISQSWFSQLVHLTSEEADCSWYKKLFSFAPRNKLVGDFTPEYAMLPVEGIKYAYAINPRIKVLLLLRSPTERALSHLKMIKLNEPLLTTNCLIEISKEKSVFERGNYPKIIDNWLSVFPKEQVMIEFYENISTDSTLFIEKLSSFFNVKIDEGKFKNKIIHGAKVLLDNEDIIRSSLESDYLAIYNEMLVRYPDLKELW